MPPKAPVVRTADAPVSTRMGGEIRPLLTPSSAGTRAGFLAELVLGTGQRTSEHYHPWSDEHVLLLEGSLRVDVDGVTHHIEAGDALFIRRGARHTMAQQGSVRARAALFLGPLAPDPADGHVDTEPVVDPDAAPPHVGTPDHQPHLETRGGRVPTSTDNSIVIDAPFDIVWDMTNDVASWPALFTEYSSAEIISSDENSVRFRLTTVPDANGKVWSWVSERFPDKANHLVTAQRVETGPFEYMRLRWDYLETDGGVEMRWRQEFTMKPDFPLDDTAMAARLNRTTRQQMAHIKSVVEARAVRGGNA